MSDPIPSGATCDHSDMDECCEGCGHFSCSCGLSWDDEAFGHFEDEWDPNDPELWGDA